ncbi:BTAD domain-containing putative transcriptional regulator [Nocardioides alcanivorans]|uniref:BTAD domain-containing putative transcriptional regulator n=1 Tax=Nocardioides alcanivorans TaxID=2897352 RepID=UPI001F425C92|nr:BTAD domain-containing putative transcriptional regulator [Nocardioides alcanivorans]
MTADSGTTPSHRLAVLGPVELTGPDGARSPGAARQRRLLTTLAVAAMEGRALSADQLVDAVYGAEAPARARRALATEIWRCRQLLGADAVVGEAEGYRLDPILIEVDLNLFVARMERGRALLDEAAFAAAADELQEALDLWRGAALMDWRDHPDTQAALARLEELRLGASEDLAEALIGSARPAAAVASLQAITQGHPAREHAWALLVEAHLASGDHRKARTTLDTARRTLGEYGVDLGSELRAVRDRVQASADEHAGVADMATPSSEPTVRPPTRPPATPTVAPAPRHPSPALTLPTWLAHPDDIVGRDDELAVVAGILTRALTNAEPSAVVVTGEAGIGKSALLRHAVNTASTPDSDALGAAIGVVHCDRRLSLPYAALTPLLAQFEHQVPGAATLLERGPEGEGEWSDTHELQQRIVDVLEEAATGLGGLLVVAEDLHWATPELVEVLLALLARRARVSIALVVTVRDNEGVSEELAAVLAELRDRALAVVRLSGLDLDQAGRLLGAGPSSAAIVDAHRLTGGNPSTCVS